MGQSQDLFHQDVYFRAMVEKLVERLRRDPAEFRDVYDMVERSKVGASKLNQLFRRHFHTTPLEMMSRVRIDQACRDLTATDKTVTEIGFDVGFENLSVFNRKFRGRTGMTPQRYRGLLGARRFQIDLPAWFSRQRILSYLGRDPTSHQQRVEGSIFRFAMAGPAMEKPGAVAQVSVRLGAEQAECSIESSSDLDWGPLVHRRLIRLLGLGTDPSSFEGRRNSSPDLVRLIEGQQGLTIPQTHDLVDALVWVIVGQQVSLRVAFGLRNRLAEHHGQDAGDGFFLVPRLETLANLKYEELQALSFSRRKAEYLIDVARSVVDGSFELDALEMASATVVEHQLLAIRGFGPWSVHYLMMRALALGDCVPVGDVALAKSLGLFFDLETRPDKHRVVELMEPFAPYRSLATFHFWHRLGNSQ